MKRLFLVCSAVLAIGCLTGCVQRLADFTFVSSKNIDLSKGADYVRSKDRVHGEDTRPIIIFPIGMPNAKEALDKAIQSVPGCVGLVDGVVELEFFGLFFGYNRFTVKGTCLIDPQTAK